MKVEPDQSGVLGQGHCNVYSSVVPQPVVRKVEGGQSFVFAQSRCNATDYLCSNVDLVTARVVRVLFAFKTSARAMPPSGGVKWRTRVVIVLFFLKMSTISLLCGPQVK